MLLFVLIFLNFIAFTLQSSLKSMLPFVRIYGPLNKIPNILLTLVVSTCESPWEMGYCLLLFSHRMGMEMIPTALPEITAALCSYLCIFCLNCPWPPVSEGSRVYRLGTVNLNRRCLWDFRQVFIHTGWRLFSAFEVLSGLPIRNHNELFDLRRGQLCWNLIYHRNNIFKEYMFISLQESNSKLTMTLS